MTTSFSGRYPIENRAGEIERLRIQAEAMAPDTRTMLGLIGLRPGWSCVDLGCGPQGITGILSEMVGPKGQVVGVDMDEVFLQHARASAPPNVAFHRADAYKTGLPEHTFDLIHMRFVAGTAGDPEGLIAEAMRLARPGGTVVLQEPDMDTLRCFPPHPAFQRVRDAMVDAFLGVGADINGAHGFYAKARRAGLTDVAYRTFIVGVRSSDPMVDYLPATAESVRGTILRLGLATEAAFDADLAACRAHLAEPDTVFTMYTVAQIWGRTPAA